jgi:gliding motility-associated-like protein
MKVIIQSIIFVLVFTRSFAQHTIELCPWNNTTFTYQSTSNTLGQWFWIIDEDTLSYNNYVTISWSSPGDYELIASFEADCGNPRDAIIIHVIECTESAIYFPNAFTPNYDNLNDAWGPIGIGIVEIKWMIFNRWGEQIYTSDSMTDRWNGSYIKRKEPGEDFYYVQEDVYVYRAWWKDVNGKSGEAVGHIVVIR